MAQLKTLMDAEHRGGLPVIFFVVNNFYGMGGQTIGETMAYERLSRIGAGINPQNMHAQTIDGNNPLAVIDAMITARQHIASGDGPVLIDCQTYRISGHSPSDASSYRTKDELDLGRDGPDHRLFRPAGGGWCCRCDPARRAEGMGGTQDQGRPRGSDRRLGIPSAQPAPRRDRHGEDHFQQHNRSS